MPSDWHYRRQLDIWRCAKTFLEIDIGDWVADHEVINGSTNRHDDPAGSQRQHKGASPIHDQPGEKGRSLLNVQQKFRIVRQLALKLHQLEVGVKLQDVVLAAASDIKVP